jgi:hypothetical protein
MAHVVGWDGSPSEEAGLDRGSVARVKLDFVASFEADLGAQPEREIQIAWFRHLIGYLLGQGFDIARVSFDSYQSADTQQVLRSQGIEVKEVSTDRTTKAWDTLRDVINDGRLEAYRRSRIVGELLGLRRLPGGNIRAASSGSKDEADAVACAVMGAIEVGGEEQTDEVPVDGEDLFGVGPNRMDAGWFADHGITSIRDLGPGRWPG